MSTPRSHDANCSTADTVFDDDDLAVAEVFCKQFGQLLSVCDRTDMQRNITRNQVCFKF